MKKHLLAILALVCSFTTSAHDFEVDGIYYKVADATNLTVAVSYKGSSFTSYSNEYSGAVTIPSTVTYNGETYSVTRINSDAFKDCTSLTSITIPESVTIIGIYAFEGCRSLTSINIPESVTSIGERAFLSCGSLTEVHISSIEAWCNIIFDVDDYGDSSNPLRYAKNLYLNGELVTELIVPDGVTSIGDHAFSGCSSLTSITIPESVTSIGDNAFEGCTSLTSIAIPESVTSIGFKAFYNCNLFSVTIGSGVKYIDRNAFNYAPKKTIWLTDAPPYNYTNAAGHINCVKNNRYAELGNVEVYPHLSSMFEVDGVTYVPVSLTGERTCHAIHRAYSDAAATIDISETISYKGVDLKVTGIMPYAFWGYDHIKEVSISCLGNIGDRAFSDCDGIETVNISNQGNIGDLAFYDCDGIESVNISNQGDVGAEAFYDCDGIESLNISNQGDVGAQAFYGCNGLKTAIVANTGGVGNKAFSGCSSLQSLTLGTRVTSLGNNLFDQCSSLTTLTSHAAVPPACGEGALVNINKFECELHIPTGCTTAYQTANQWKDFLYVIDDVAPVKVASITLSQSTATLTEGETLTLTATVMPDDATDKTVAWSSSDESVATVDANGMVTAVAAGTATITATAGDYSSTCVITVEKGYIAVSGIILSQTTATLVEGETLTLTATVMPDDATDKTVTWSTSDERIATVDANGVVTAVAAGTAAITATAGDKEAVCVVTVTRKEEPFNGITSIDELSNETLYHITLPHHSRGLASWAVAEGGAAMKSHADLGLTPDANDTKQQFAFISNDGGATRYLYHAAEKKFVGKKGVLTEEPVDAILFKDGAHDNTFFAYFDENNYINVGGSQQMTIDRWSTADGGNSCVIAPVAVFNPAEALAAFVVKVSGITLSQTAATLTEGESLTLTATVSPEDATDKTVTWSTSDERIASVDANGVVTAVAAGTATITATAGDYSSTCVITVEKREIAVSGITLSQSAVNLIEGESLTLTATVSPEDATDKTVTWSTSDERIAAVDANGVVTAVAAGTAAITATAGDKETVCVVTVTRKEEPFNGITSIDELSNETLYHITLPHHSRGLASWAVAEGGAAMKSHADLGLTPDATDAKQQFAFISNDGGATRYLYHAAEKKFVGKKGVLTEEPVDAILFKDGAHDNTFFAYFDENNYINVGGSSQMTIDWWSTPDGGNSCAIIPVGDFDPTEALEAFPGVKEVTGITLSQSTATLTEGETFTLTATVTPGDATDRTVTWSSSDESVATVDANGVVTAVAAGTATITATAGDEEATCVVTVSLPDGIEQLTNDKGQLTIYDLTGRKVLDTENLKGGIYIINGKKVVIK